MVRFALVAALAAFAGLAIGQLKPANAPYQVSADFKEVGNYKTFIKANPLSARQKAALAKNLFFTYPLGDEEMYWIYGRNDYENVSSIVTADNVLQLFHIFFDSTLRIAEQTELNNALRALSTSLASQTAKRYQSLKGTSLETAALKNLAYFGVAANLAGLKPSLPTEAKRLVDAELALIKAHEGFKKGAIFPYEIDYSQFIVRGHYTKTPVLGRYFQAMMWFGLVPISIDKIENGRRVLIKEQAVQSLLLARDLQESKAYPRWQRIYEVTSLFAGESNNLTPTEWWVAAKKVFPAGGDVNAYADNAKLNAFLTEIQKARKPDIVQKHRGRDVAGPIQLRFMGQRAIPDSIVLQELSDPDSRPFPSPLDVMAVFGNVRAKQILDAGPQTYNPKNWNQYRPLREQLMARFSALPESTWSRDLYWSWLDSLRAFTAPAPSGYPSFMRNRAWADRMLYSALASWAELRHDTILYGMQSVAEMGDGEDEEPPFVKGYIEPKVAFYKRLKAALLQMRDGLKSNGFLSKTITEDFDGFSEVLTFFIRVSESELANKSLSKKDHERIRKIEGELESLNYDIMATASGYQQLSNDDLDMAQVADVHTAFGQALTVAVGRADGLLAIVPIDGKLMLARGSSLSYYEFLVPVSQRMTDKAWQEMLNDGKAPARPAWTGSFFVNEELGGD